MKRSCWSSWSEYLNVSSSDILEEFSETVVPLPKSHVMKLPVKDMHLFGQCSEYDDFYLVICQICGKSIKPQSLKYHIELRHQKISMNNFSISKSVEESSRHTFSKSNCSNENLTNEDMLSKFSNSTNCSVLETKVKIKSMSNKRRTVYVQPYPRPSSVNSCQKRNVVKIASHSPSSDMVVTSLARSIAAENYESVKNTCPRQMSFPESSSTCDSKTSMTVFLHRSFVLPNMKLCDINDRHNNHLQCLSKSLPENNCLSNSAILTQVLPENMGRQNVQSPIHVSQVHNSSEGVGDWSCIQNSTNVDLNRMAYDAWNQHSSHFRPLPHTLPITKSGQINSHSFNCSDLSKKFDLESQVLIHNAAMGT